MNIRSSNAVLKAYDILITQPVTANGLSPAERDAIIVSAIVDEHGETLVLSRLGDSKWDLRPFFDQANVAEYFKFISWDTSIPQMLIDDCKAVTYA